MDKNDAYGRVVIYINLEAVVRRCSSKYVLKTFANFIAKHLCWSQNTSKGCFCNSQFGIFFFHVARIDGRGIMISAFSFFLFSFANSIYLKKKNEKKNKLLRFDGIDLSHRKSKISKEFT